jgi:hypothetical protein
VKQAKALHPDVTLVTGDWNPETPVAAAIKAVSNLTTAVKRSSKTVIVLGDPPAQRRQPVDCLLAAHATMKTCSTRVTKAALYGNLSIATAAKKHHVAYINSLGWFCGRISKRVVYLCPLVVNRTITRRDKDHVSSTYALELLSPFRGAFRRALFQ